MILLYILLFLFALILIILMSDIKADLKYDNCLKVTVRFWFLKFDLPQKKDKQPKKTREEAYKNKEETEQTKKKNYIKQLIDDKGLVSAMGELVSVVKSILLELGKTAEHIRIKCLKLYISVASEDPAATAVQYGALCAVVFPSLRFVEEKTKLCRKQTDVFVNSDFSTGNPQFEFNSKLKLRVVFVVAFALKLLWELVSVKIKAAQQKV